MGAFISSCVSLPVGAINGGSFASKDAFGTFTGEVKTGLKTMQVGTKGYYLPMNLTPRYVAPEYVGYALVYVGNRVICGWKYTDTSEWYCLLWCIYH